ncbi:MAG: ABC transporter substrate-binding protein, partial [Clostridia bacterium]|nr:ABC transporter substrate-binding protein [Clostridia bacterium]
MKHTTRILALLLVAVMLVLSFAACGKSKNTEAATTAPGGSEEENSTPLVVGYSPFNEKFSPFFSETAYDQDVWVMTQLSLLTSDRQGNVIQQGINGTTVPYNGKDYTYYGPADLVIDEKEDGTVDYKFTLKQGLKFSDGTPITIDDVIFTMYAFSDPTYDGSTTLFALPIKGMDAYRAGMDTWFNLLYLWGKDNTNFSFWTEAQQTEFWTKFDAAVLGLAE